MKVEAYLMFNGQCEDAVKFYQQAVGAKVEMMMRYGDAPDKPPPGMLPPGSENKIMHASFRIGETIVMASDDMSMQQTGFKGFYLSVHVKDEAEADRAFNALAAGGKVRMPLMKTFWSPRFGMLEDRFGVAWMVNVVQEM